MTSFVNLLRAAAFPFKVMATESTTSETKNFDTLTDELLSDIKKNIHLLDQHINNVFL